MLKKGDIILNGVYACMDRAVVALYRMGFIIYFARALPKSDFGLFSLASVIYILGITFCDLSIGQALIHYGAGEKRRDFQNLLFNGLILKFAFFILISIVILFSAPLISSIFKNGGLAKIVRLMPLLMLTTFLYNTHIQALNAKEQVRNMFYVDLFLLCILVAGAYLTYKYNLISDAYTAVIFLIVVRTIASLFAYIFIIKEAFVRTAFKINTKIIKDIYIYSRFSFANSLGVFVFSKTDIFMLGLMLDHAHVAVYASAVVVTNIFRLLNEPMNVLTLPIISKLHLRRSPRSNQMIRRIYVIACTIAFAISLPISILLLVFPQEILQLLYGGKYIEAIGLIRLFALWGLILPFYRCAATVFNGISKPHINAKYTWLAGVVNILLNVPLIYYFKTTGAAIASIITASILLLAFIYTLQSLFQIFQFRPKPFKSSVEAVK